MTESILRAAGYRTGLYISPYIQDFCERMQVNGENIPGQRLADITERVRAIADAMADHPSQFELVTAIAMVYFLEEHCDIVVLEVGMGGAIGLHQRHRRAGGGGDLQHRPGAHGISGQHPGGHRRHQGGHHQAGLRRGVL